MESGREPPDPDFPSRLTHTSRKCPFKKYVDTIRSQRLVGTGQSRGDHHTLTYWEYKGGFFDPRNVSIPVAVSAFPDEIYQAPKSWTEKAYPKLIYYNRLPKGGHFAAWEQPDLFSAELRAAFRPLR